MTLGPNVWLGAGSPSNFALPIPPNPGLVGIELHVQGLVVDPTFTNTFGASRGLKAKIGG